MPETREAPVPAPKRREQLPPQEEAQQLSEDPALQEDSETNEGLKNRQEATGNALTSMDDMWSKGETPKETLLTIPTDEKDVKTLQNKLIAEGYNLGSWGADGKAGKLTRAAVKAYNKKLASKKTITVKKPPEKTPIVSAPHEISKPQVSPESKLSSAKDPQLAKLITKGGLKGLAKKSEDGTVRLTSKANPLRIKNLVDAAYPNPLYVRKKGFPNFVEAKGAKLTGKNRIRISKGDEICCKAPENLLREHSIEGMQLREWTEADSTAFSEHIAKNLSNPDNLKKYIKENDICWNPKGNPDLYAQQHCVETAVIFLIDFCYKNSMNLALPVGVLKDVKEDGTKIWGTEYKTLSDYKTIEAFMQDVYPNLSASHFFGAGELFTELNKNGKDCRPGDYIARKHKKGGYHAQLISGKPRKPNGDEIWYDKKGIRAITARDKNGNIITDKHGKDTYEDVIPTIQGNQLNNDFKKSQIIRDQVANDFSTGFASENNRKRFGGFGIEPEEIGENLNALRKNAGDEVKILRFNPAGLNSIVKRYKKNKKTEVT